MKAAAAYFFAVVFLAIVTTTTRETLPALVMAAVVIVGWPWLVYEISKGRREGEKSKPVAPEEESLG